MVFDLLKLQLSDVWSSHPWLSKEQSSPAFQHQELKPAKPNSPKRIVKIVVCAFCFFLVVAPSGRWGEQGDGAWVLHSVVGNTRKHWPEVVVLLGKFAANNAQCVHMCREMGPQQNLEEDECGRGIPTAAGTQGTAPEWCLALGPRAGHHNAWSSISLLVPLFLVCEMGETQGCFEAG